MRFDCYKEKEFAFFLKYLCQVYRCDIILTRGRCFAFLVCAFAMTQVFWSTFILLNIFNIITT